MSDRPKWDPPIETIRNPIERLYAAAHLAEGLLRSDHAAGAEQLACAIQLRDAMQYLRDNHERVEVRPA